jgi:hypothetical protein
MVSLELGVAFLAVISGQTNLPEVSSSGQVTTPIPIVTFPGQTQTVNVINWDSNSLPRIFQRSDQLPLTDEDITKLSKAGFATADLVKMIEQRRCTCDASADGLIRLKKQGVAKEVISAVSLHGLKPNRVLNLEIRLDFTGDGREARENFLYLFVDDGNITRVLTANIGDLLGRSNAHESMIDKSDILIARQVRRVVLPGDLPLKTYGRHNVLVVASARPTLTHPSQLTEDEKMRVQSYFFDYPRSSLQSVCRMTAGYKRDAVLTYRWHFVGSRFECEFN